MQLRRASAQRATGQVTLKRDYPRPFHVGKMLVLQGTVLALTHTEVSPQKGLGAGCGG